MVTYLKLITKNLVEISDGIAYLNKKLDKLLEIHSMPNCQISADISDILNLPKHLQETYLALHKIKRGCAEDVSKITKKARAVESHYLNQLVNIGKVLRTRNGKKVIFQCRTAF